MKNTFSFTDLGAAMAIKLRFTAKLPLTWLVRAFFQIIVLMSFSCAHAQYYNGSTLAQVSLNEVISQVQPGTILIIGEIHGQGLIRDQQLSILQSLRTRSLGAENQPKEPLKISVGMEFFNYTDQDIVQKFRRQEIAEPDFLKAINWGGFPFNLYGPQLLFPQENQGERGIALNMPRTVTGVISKQGLQGLSPELQKLMPPQFELGREAYRERFYDLMGGGHIPAEKLANYFASQSTWDETMAWQTLEFMKTNPTHVFVIIVGEFHVQYGGGLPSALQRRINLVDDSSPIKNLNIQTISQIFAEGLSEEDLKKELEPSEKYGPRADFINVVKP